MKPKPIRFLALLGLVAIALCLPAAVPGASAQGGGQPSSGPVAGPIEIFTFAEVVGSPFGPLLETTLIVENSGAEAAQLLLLGRLGWPDGSSNLLRYGPPTVLPPNSTLILVALSPVPPGVGSGTGTFRAQAFVGPLGHGGRGGQRGALIARDQSEFELP